MSSGTLGLKALLVHPSLRRSAPIFSRILKKGSSTPDESNFCKAKDVIEIDGDASVADSDNEMDDEDDDRKDDDEDEEEDDDKEDEDEEDEDDDDDDDDEEEASLDSRDALFCAINSSCLAARRLVHIACHDARSCEE